MVCGCAAHEPDGRGKLAQVLRGARNSGRIRLRRRKQPAHAPLFHDRNPSGAANAKTS